MSAFLAFEPERKRMDRCITKQYKCHFCTCIAISVLFSSIAPNRLTPRVQGSCRNVPPLRQAPGPGLTTLQPTQVSVGHRSGRYLLTNPAPVRTCSVVIDRNNNSGRTIFDAADRRERL